VNHRPLNPGIPFMSTESSRYEARLGSLKWRSLTLISERPALSRGAAMANGLRFRLRGQC
jgi:hypothetical protein